MKRVLIVSMNSISSHANNGKTLAGIFSLWDRDHLAQLYFQDEIPETERFNSFFRVRDVDILRSIFFRLPRGARVKPKRRVASHHEGKRASCILIIKILKSLGTVKLLARKWLYGSKRWLSDDLICWVSSFNPQAIFLLGSQVEYPYKISTYLSQKFGVPLYIYFTDDYLGGSLSGCPLARYVEYRNKRTIIKSMHVAKKCFVIGEEMEFVYNKRYGLEFDVLINPVDIKIDSKSESVYKRKKKYVFLYAGGLTLGRLEAVLNFAKVIRDCSLSFDISCTFDVCSGDALTPRERRRLKRSDINFLGKLDHTELLSKYEEIDFLLHVESDKDEFIKKTKLSVSTKIPESLSSGRCLIAFGPAEVASMKLIYKNGIGFYIDSRADAAAVAQRLGQYIVDSELCNQVSKKALDYSFVHFNKAVIAERLLTIISSAD